MTVVINETQTVLQSLPNFILEGTQKRSDRKVSNKSASSI